jgi:hypothetical protein
MAEPKPKWPPEQIEAWRKDLRNKQTTVTEIAKREGVHRQRIYQLLRRPEPSKRSGKRHTQEHCIWCAQKWVELYHYTPASTDWSPTRAKNQGQPERAERFYRFRKKFDCPTTTTVQELFGSWSKMICRAGLEPAPEGYPAQGRWK